LSATAAPISIRLGMIISYAIIAIVAMIRTQRLALRQRGLKLDAAARMSHVVLAANLLAKELK
jgi:hypothetical protein